MDQHFLRLAQQAYRFPNRAHYCLRQTPTDNLTACHYWLNRLKKPTAYAYWTQAQLCTFQGRIDKALEFFDKAKNLANALPKSEQTRLRFVHQFWQGYLHPQANTLPLLQTLQTYLNPIRYQTPLENIETIVVLGHKLNADSTASDALLNRLTCAHDWANVFPNAPILLSGKGAHPVHSEAEIMANHLIKQGMDAKRFILENRSMNTLENAQYSLPLLQSVKNALIITDWAHQPRAQTIFHFTQQKTPNGETQFFGRSPHIERDFNEAIRLNTHIDALRSLGFAGFYCPPYSAF